MISRRKFLQNGSSIGLLGFVPGVAMAKSIFPETEKVNADIQEIISLNGFWDFRFDTKDIGIKEKWFSAIGTLEDWNRIEVPYTWQIDPSHADYLGIAWYKKDFYAPDVWKGKTIRIEFEAVYHSARVWLNGQPAGDHLLDGYTAFFVDITKTIKMGAVNTIVVQVNNAFNSHMLPRGSSFDWAVDGGIIRPVSLYITGPFFTERVAITSKIDLEDKKTKVNIASLISNNGDRKVSLEVAYKIFEEKSATLVVNSSLQRIDLNNNESKAVNLNTCVIENPLLWHFDHPHLYVLELQLWKDGKLVHSLIETFGIRKIEVKDNGFYLNGERVWLMGVERMAGSNPNYGMAEPTEWIQHDHRDLKILNCVFTRAHWQQDKRVLDYCDRHGIFIQSEVPTWGSATFEGMKGHIDGDIMQNGLVQLQEMIHRDRNHPCIFSWGLCNEIGGQNPPAYEFATNMLKEAKKLDPDRLCSYASNSLEQTPGKDVSGLMDFVEWNEYYESWYKGTIQDMEKNLEAIHSAFPDKPIVISEYGWCRCTPDRKVGDPKKIEILKSHDAVFRKHDYVGGLIFFDYNDYRTHMGDKGIGPLKQRVHGVVDIYGLRKPSFNVLRYESGPIESLNCWLNNGELNISLQTRETIPTYILRDYNLHWIIYADQNIPLEEGNILLPELKPGGQFSHSSKLLTPNIEKIKVEVLRPAGFSSIYKIIFNDNGQQQAVSEY